MVEYAELHCHSAFSLLEGATLPEKLVDTAVELGLRALALTDHDDLGGVVRFAHRARASNDYPAIIGLDSTVVIDGEDSHLTLLARTEEGYAHLALLVSEARRASPRGIPRVDEAFLAQHAGGLLCLTGCLRGRVSRALWKGDTMGARRVLGRLKDLFGEHLAVEVMDHGLTEEALLTQRALALSRNMGTPWVVTNQVYYARPQDRILHDVLMCLKLGTTLDDAGARLRPNAEWHLKSPVQMAQRWRHNLEGVHASVSLAERCEFRLHHLRASLPSMDLPEGFGDPDAYLAHLTHMGACDRWGRGLGEWHHLQMEKELALIRRRGLAGYFLIMWEIVEFARSANILVQGRGSAANSAVCYCLGITAVDPIRYDLLFERFLSDEREGYPDIDLDIEHNRREEVIQFVYAHYGRAHAAMVCAHHCFRGRGAVRDTGRVLGLSVDDCGRLAEAAQQTGVLTAAGLTAQGFEITEPRMAALLMVTQGLWGLPRHRSTHTGGFVLSTRPISEITGVEPAGMEGRTILQWDKDDLDLMRIPKFDLLGLGILSVIAEGLHLVRVRHDPKVRLYSLPDRQEVYDMIALADTVGVFQIESRAQMNSLPRTRPNTLYELAIQVALIRPGPLQGDMVHPYIRRKRGEEPIDLIHPVIAPILRRTLGVPIFQEQGMRLAVEAAYFTPGEAESLRRAIGSARHRIRLGDLLDRLRSGLARRGIDAKAVERIVEQIESFSTYGFPESHSTSFALLVYGSAWLKYFYPAEFLCALLNAQPMGFYSPATLVKEAQRHGVEVRAPCLKRSAWCSQMEGASVRLGLRTIRGLGSAAKRTLEEARALGVFSSAQACIRRCVLPRKSWLVLAESGAFDAFFGTHRRNVIWEVLHLERAARDTLPLPLAEEAETPFSPPSALENTVSDLQTMGLTTGLHPMAHLRQVLGIHEAKTALDLKTLRNGQWVKIAGQVISRQRPSTAKGFCFVSLEDEYGFVNVIVPPRRFEQYWSVIIRARFLWVEGVVCCEQGVWNVRGHRFDALSFGGAEYVPSGRNFK